MLLVDTCIYYGYANNDPVVVQNWNSFEASQINLCDTVVGEILTDHVATLAKFSSGTFKGKGTIVQAYGSMNASLADINEINCLQYTDAAHAEYQRLKKLHPGMSVNDCRIAATAIVHSAILVTENVKHFRDVMPTGSLQDWTRPDRSV